MRRIQIQKRRQTSDESAELDLRTPAGRQLPF
jgi:hypothetical protein